MDNYSSADNSLGAGISEQLYDGRIYPYPSGAGRYHRVYPNHSGSENFVVKTPKSARSERYWTSKGTNKMENWKIC